MLFHTAAMGVDRMASAAQPCTWPMTPPPTIWIGPETCTAKMGIPLVPLSFAMASPHNPHGEVFSQFVGVARAQPGERIDVL